MSSAFTPISGGANTPGSNNKDVEKPSTSKAGFKKYTIETPKEANEKMAEIRPTSQEARPEKPPPSLTKFPSMPDQQLNPVSVAEIEKRNREERILLRDMLLILEAHQSTASYEVIIDEANSILQMITAYKDEREKILESISTWTVQNEEVRNIHQALKRNENILEHMIPKLNAIVDQAEKAKEAQHLNASTPPIQQHDTGSADLKHKTSTTTTPATSPSISPIPITGAPESAAPTATTTQPSTTNPSPAIPSSAASPVFSAASPVPSAMINTDDIFKAQMSDIKKAVKITMELLIKTLKEPDLKAIEGRYIDKKAQLEKINQLMKKSTSPETAEQSKTLSIEVAVLEAQLKFYRTLPVQEKPKDTATAEKSSVTKTTVQKPTATEGLPPKHPEQRSERRKTAPPKESAEKPTRQRRKSPLPPEARGVQHNTLTPPIDKKKSDRRKSSHL